MKNSNAGFATIILVVSILLAGLGIGYFVGLQKNLINSFYQTPQRLATLTEEESTSTAKKVALEQEIKEATPIPTPTSTPTPTPTATPKPTSTPKPKPTAKPTETPVSNTQSTLSLTAVSDETGKVKLSWTLNGSTGNGFKTAYSKNPNPSYPSDKWHYLGNEKRDDIFTDLPSGEKLHFRVGIYVGGENPVSVYSNDVEVTVK